MDRAVVNALHHLYRNGACSMAEVLALLWCGPDTEDAVDDLTEQVGELRRVSPYLNKFIKELEWQLTSLPGAGYVLGNPMSVPARKRGEARPAFAAMPYGPAWFRTVCDVIFACACTTGVALEGSKDISVPGTIRDQIWVGIRRAEVVVADITEQNPNVEYEIGLAHALGMHTILKAREQAPLPLNSSASCGAQTATIGK